MATITTIRNKKGVTYRAQIRKFYKGAIIYTETRTFPKKVLAERWASRREEQLREEGGVERIRNTGVKVIDLIDRYIADFATNSGRSKKADLNTLRVYDFAQVPIHHLTSEMLIEHATQRLKTVKPQTLLNDFVWLKVIFDAAYPAWGIKVTSSEIVAAKAFCQSKNMVHSSEIRDRRPSDKELALLDSHFASRDGRSTIPMQDIMWFAIHSARRQGEIVKLLWSDNNEKAMTGMVRDIKHPRKKGLNKTFKYTKEAWEIVQRQPRIGDRIFPFNSNSIGSAFTRACHLLEIHDLRYHDLRHEATSRLFEAGYSIPEVQLFTLHESWGTLSRYANLRPENLSLRSETPS